MIKLTVKKTIQEYSYLGIIIYEVLAVITALVCSFVFSWVFNQLWTFMYILICDNLLVAFFEMREIREINKTF